MKQKTKKYNKKSKTNKEPKVLYVILILALLGALMALMSLVVLQLLWFNDNIHQPALASVREGCGLIEEAAEDNYIEAAETTATQKITIENGTRVTAYENIKIVIFDSEENSDELNEALLKHELCHVKQINRKFLGISSCSPDYGKFRRYLNEVECYWVMRSPLTEEDRLILDSVIG